MEGCATHPTRRENPQRHKPPPPARDNTERIREIGVRRAIGAKARHIFTQILVESTVVGIIGGILGLAAALGMTHLIKFTTDGASLPVIQTASGILSFAFAVLIGVLSGIYSAWTASRIAPIEALRYG